LGSSVRLQISVYSPNQTQYLFFKSIFLNIPFPGALVFDS
jgi:hypothetical protein